MRFFMFSLLAKLTCSGSRQCFSSIATAATRGMRLKQNMTAIATKTSIQKTPGSICYTPNEKYGMDKLSSYTMSNCPIVALGSTFIAIDKHGGSSWGSPWGSGIPKDLDDKLRGRQSNLPKANLVCLGVNDNDDYFVQFNDGCSDWSWSLPDYLQGFLKGSPSISALAIGPESSFYVKNGLGNEIYEDLPKGLDNALTGRKNSLPEVYNVNLGADGEWFVRFMDGSWSSDSLSDSRTEAINEIKGKGGKIREILFGLGGTWMIRYDY